jgi:hypothetical protein
MNIAIIKPENVISGETELIYATDSLEEGRIKINHAYSAYTLLWSSTTGDNSIVMNNDSNFISGNNSVSVGFYNTITGDNSAILGGTGHALSGSRSVIVGGRDINGILNDTAYLPSLVSNTFTANQISASTIFLNGQDVTTINGTSGDLWISGSTPTAIIANNSTNTSSSPFSLVAGNLNQITDSATTISTTGTTILAGFNNIINGGTIGTTEFESHNSFIGSGENNFIDKIVNSSITSGKNNKIRRSSTSFNPNYSIITSGENNEIINSSFTAILGGKDNTTNSKSTFSTIGYGILNESKTSFSETNGSGATSVLFGQRTNKIGIAKNFKLIYSRSYSLTGDQQLFLDTKNSSNSSASANTNTIAFNWFNLKQFIDAYFNFNIFGLVVRKSDGASRMFELNGLIRYRIESFTTEIFVKTESSYLDLTYNPFITISQNSIGSIDFNVVSNIGFTNNPTLKLRANASDSSIRIFANTDSNVHDWIVCAEFIELPI